MKILNIINTLRDSNISLWVENDSLRYRAPKGVLTPEIRALLTKNKEELLNELNAEEKDVITTFPLSHNQKSLWFLHFYAPDSPAYNMGVAFRVKSSIDIDAFKRALNKLVARHEVLRTTYDPPQSAVNGQPRQYVHKNLEPEFTFLQTSGMSENDIRNMVEEHLEEPFDLEKGPVLRANVFFNAAEDYIILISMHHIASDATTLKILFDELPLLYQSEVEGEQVELPQISFSYSDYVQEQEKMLDADDHLLDFWKKQLATAETTLELSTDYERPPFQQLEGSTLRIVCEDPLYQEIKDCASKKNVTRFIFLLSVFQLLLMRYSHQKEFTIGTLASGRTRNEYQNICGYFVNPIVLKAFFASEMTFLEHLEKTRSILIEALDHQSLPFSFLVEKLSPKREQGRSPLFQILFCMLQRKMLGNAAHFLYEKNLDKSIEFGPLKAYPYPLPQQAGQFDLTLEVVDMDEYFIFDFKYSDHLFHDDTVRKMAEDYQKLISSLLNDPLKKTDDVPINMSFK